MKADARELLLSRLREDLIGPSLGPHELIGERPSDRYLTGILYPQRTEATAEEDDSLGSGNSGDGDEGEADQVAMMRMMRPATAGLSFAVAGKGPHLRITVHCGRYEEVEQDTGESANSDSAKMTNNVDDAQESPQPKAKRKLRPTSKWKRIPLKADLVIAAARKEPVDLSEYDIPGLELSLQCTPHGDELLVTAVLVNRNTVAKGESRLASDTKAFFQVGMDIQAVDDALIPARPSRHASLDDDSRSSALLYRDAVEFAVGHTCSADWVSAPNAKKADRISIAWIPTADVAATSNRGGGVFERLIDSPAGRCLDSNIISTSASELPELLTPLTSAYEEWIKTEEARINSLAVDLRAQGRLHMDECRKCLKRMRSGIALIEEDEDVATAFRLANRAMSIQFEWTRGKGSVLTWRPFQLGFLLLTLESVARRNHSDRTAMDLLWFPTGGGKTEAYLALVAFTLFLRRLKSPGNPDRGAGTAAIMRYTLRLLTTQQFQRAAALILACEHIRRSDRDVKKRTGSIPFSLGLWVGMDAVANKVAEALRALEENKPNRPDQLTNCPACNGLLAWGPGARRQYVKVECLNNNCVLSGDELPIWTVDEDVYDRLPSLLIGTVDKFAQLPRQARAGRIFGLNVPHDSPDLVIQDELHLISGPLGTLAGLYEAAIDELCSNGDIRPKVIGSTATIRRAAEQILAIFDRSAQLFPPPGLDAADSCFAVRDLISSARRYAAVTTAGRSAKFTLQAVAASLLQTADAVLQEDPSADTYWTLVGYFNALRELGGALVLMQDDVPSTVEQFAARRNERPRQISNVSELTSRLSQTELRDRLAELDFNAASGASIDVLLATNMISVGIDISRLGLMIMNGQPKTVAEYIQATSRVGRGTVPGLVVSIYNNAKARDRSRFETFRTWHETLYREVEATSVTPFSSRARDRGLHAALVTLARHLIPALQTSPVLGDSEDEVRLLAERIIKRAGEVEPEEENGTREQVESLIEQWSERIHLDRYFNDRRPVTSLMISAERAATLRAVRKEIGDAWPTPSSLRSVEPMTKVSLIEKLRADTEEDDDGE